MTSGLTVDLVARYPVKGLRGESIEVIELDHRGVVGDRRWALRTLDGTLGATKATARTVRLPRLDEMTATVLWGIHTVIKLPDGREFAATDPQVHEAVSEIVGQPVQVVEETDEPHLDVAPVYLLTAKPAEDWMRPRPNLLVNGDQQHTWIGRRVEVGTAEIEITTTAPHCAAPDSLYAVVTRPGVIGTGDSLRFL